MSDNQGISREDSQFFMVCFVLTWLLIVAGIIITNDHVDQHLAKPNQIERSYVSQ